MRKSYEDFEHAEDYFAYLLDNHIPFVSEDIWEMIDDYEYASIRGEDHRWACPVQSICRIKDKYYAVDWMAGLTECQENEWDPSSQPYEVTPVEKVITVTHWVEV